MAQYYLLCLWYIGHITSLHVESSYINKSTVDNFSQSEKNNGWAYMPAKHEHFAHIIIHNYLALLRPNEYTYTLYQCGIPLRGTLQ